MNNIIKLNNNYYAKILDNQEKVDRKLTKINDLKITNILKEKDITLKIDFKELDEKKYKKILKKILFIKNLLFTIKKKIGFEDDGKIIVAYIYNYDKKNANQKDLIAGIKAILYNTRYERYNYIYDYVCEYLDSYFYGKNLCDFKDNQCGEKRKTTSLVGCCHHYKNKILGPLLKNNFVKCEYLNKDFTCGAKCIGCKLFTCDYLNKKGIKFKIKDILLLDTFFNPIQKYFIKCMVFTPKDKIIKRLVAL